MDKTNLLSLNIAFIPPKEVEEEAIALSRQITAQNKVYFTLDDQNFFPHITIYQLIIPKKHLNKLLEILRQESFVIKKAQFEFLHFQHGVGFLGAYFKKTNHLEQIHRQIVGKTNFLREENKITDYWLNLYKGFTFTPKQIQNHKDFGYFLVHDLYVPHLIITRLEEGIKVDAYSEKMQWRHKQFVCEEIGLYILGENGICTKLIEKFKLKGVD